MNTWSGIGNLVKNPESYVSQAGTDVCKFTIAVNRPKDANGQQQADFIPIKAFGRRAALCREYLAKGRKVGVVGKLQTYNYQKDDGTIVFGFEVVLDDLTFLYSGDPNKPQLGDVHADDGVIHNKPPHDISDFTEVEDEELPF